MKAARERPQSVTDVAAARPDESAGTPSGSSGYAAIESPTEAQWYAIWTLSNTEFVVENTLRGYGIEAFLPTWPEVVQWSDRKKTIHRPLFPGYLFARCEGGPDGDNAPRREILRIAGVIDVLPNALSPRAIDAAEIENVRQLVASGLPMKVCDYVSGDEVKIESGALAGVKGIVQRTKNGTRVVVKIEILRRAVSVEIDADELTKEKRAA